MFRCKNIVLLKTRFFNVAEFTLLTPLSLLSCYRLSFPVVDLKISPPPICVSLLIVFCRPLTAGDPGKSTLDPGNHVGSRSCIRCSALRTQKQRTQDRPCNCAAVILCMLILVSAAMSSRILSSATVSALSFGVLSLLS